MTPAEELKAAAEQLRQDVRSALADSPLPWTITDEHVIRCGTNGSIVVDRSCDPDEAGDLPYLARMHPGVGAALADWLDVAAEMFIDGHYGNCSPTTCINLAALAVAREVLGSQP